LKEKKRKSARDFLTSFFVVVQLFARCEGCRAQ
jgi:hypothetical protein